MEELKAAVYAVCAISAVKCAVGNISAASRMRKQVTALMDLMLALALIVPAVNAFRSFELPEIRTFDPAELGISREYYRQTLAEQTARNVEDVLAAQLSAAGISCGRISAEVNISEDYSISITKVTVSTDACEAAAAVIRSCLGAETEVIADVEQDN